MKAISRKNIARIGVVAVLVVGAYLLSGPYDRWDTENRIEKHGARILTSRTGGPCTESRFYGDLCDQQVVGPFTIMTVYPEIFIPSRPNQEVDVRLFVRIGAGQDGEIFSVAGRAALEPTFASNVTWGGGQWAISRAWSATWFADLRHHMVELDESEARSADAAETKAHKEKEDQAKSRDEDARKKLDSLYSDKTAKQS